MALGFSSALGAAGMTVAHGVVTIGYDDAAVDAGLARTEAETRKGAGLMSKTMLGFGAATAVALGAGAKMAMDFQSKMRLIQTSAGGSARDVRLLSKAVLDLAKDTPYGPEQLADSLFHLKSLGLDNAKAMDVLKQSVRGAIAGQADLEAVTNTLGGAVRTNIKGAENYTQAMATLNATTGAGNMRMDELTAAMGTGVLPVAKLAGLSLRDVGASLALMTDENVPATAAMTRFKTALMMMQKPSAAAAKEMAAMGLSSQQIGDKIRGPGGWLSAVRMIAKAYETMVKSEGKTKAFATMAGAFGGARGASTIMMLANNIGVLSKKYEQIDKNVGQFNQDVAAGSKTASMQIKTAWSSVQVALIGLGNVVLPILVKIAKALATVTTFAMRHTKILKALTIVLAFAATAWGIYKVALFAETVASKLSWLWTNKNIQAKRILTGTVATETTAIEAETGALTQEQIAQRESAAGALALRRANLLSAASFAVLGAAAVAAALTLKHYIAEARKAQEQASKSLGNEHHAEDSKFGRAAMVYNLDYKRYLAQGMTPAEARAKAVNRARNIDPMFQKAGDTNIHRRHHKGHDSKGKRKGGATGPRPIATTMPDYLTLKAEQAAATATSKDDLRVAEEQRAWILGQIRMVKSSKESPAMKRQQLLALYSLLDTATGAIASNRSKTAGGGIRGGGIALPLSLQLAEAKAATTKSKKDDQRVTRAEIRYLDSEIRRVKSSHMHKKKKQEELVQLYQMLAQEQNALDKKTKMAQHAADTSAFDALSQLHGWMGEFASNIFHETKGGLRFGPVHHHKTVHLTQHITRPVHSQFETMHSARYAAQAAL